MVGIVALAVLTSFGSKQVNQDFRTTAGTYVDSHKWNVESQGPLLYLPVRTQQVKDDPHLEGGFGPFPCGSLHVIAPTQMTVIDPDYRQPANIYDGLPRQLKVLYLASTFSPAQWQTACSTGIGLSDMNRDQQAVYRSVLPSVFQFQTGPVWDPNGKSSSPGAPTQTTLTPDQESEVRLKIYKEMTLGVRLGNQGSFSAMSPQEWQRHKPGEMRSFRTGDASEDKNFVFGVEVRKAFPNASKSSDLDYKSSAFDVAMPLTPSSSVKEICQAASNLTHSKIVPDARFQNESVTTLGTTARAGDVLKGLALCLTGTYRKVGSTYVLTSDVEGVGTKMTKLAFWQWNLKQIADKESEKWKSQIAANPGIRSIAYALDDSFTPNDAMRKFMDSDFEQGNKTMPASQLSPAWAQILNSKDAHFFETLRTDVAEPWDSVFWSFVAPGDKELNWESELGDLNEFTHYVDRHPASAPRKEPNKVSLGSLPGSALVYQSEDPTVASELPKVAKSLGFTELWLQTTNSKSLTAAIQNGKAAGIPIRLVVEPFEAFGNMPKDQFDRTILGDSFSQAQTLIEGSDWVESSNQSFTANERPVDFIRHDSASLETVWKRLKDLASSTDLSGTVALSVTPVGYEPQSEWGEFEPPQMSVPLMLGYTPGVREKFLLANSVDPVDLLEVRDQFNLQPLEQSISSFGDLNNYLYGKVAESSPSYRDKWDKMRSEVNEERLRQFESIFGVPSLVEWRRRLQGTSMNWDSVVSPLTGDAPVQTMKDDPYGAMLPDGAYYLQKIGYPLSEGAIHFQCYHISIRVHKQATRLAIDMRAVPAERLEQAIKLLFIP